MSLSLGDLATSTHPLLEEGSFSIYNDPSVGCTNTVEKLYDLDGICFVSRSLDTFNVCPIGESRVYTDSRVSDKHQFLYKTRIFDPDVYDPLHKVYAKYNPGFKLVDLTGADLLVVGVVNKNGALEEIESVKNNPALVSTSFYREVFNPSVRDLPYDSRTRQSNAAEAGDRFLPKLYRIYPKDVAALSLNIKRAMRSRRDDAPSLFHRVFLPLVELPSHARKQVFGMLSFLEKLRVNDRQQVAQKAASVLVEHFFDELIQSGQVPRPSVLRRPGALVRCSCSVNGVVTAMMYARKVFDPEQLPRHHRLYSFLKTALSFADEEDLFRALAAELLRNAKFVPQVVIHESRQNISSTSYQVLSPATFGYLKDQASIRELTADECGPLLTACQVILMREFSLDIKRSKDVSRCTPDTCSLLTALLRRVDVTNQTHGLALLVLGLVERARMKGLLNKSIKTRWFQRSRNFSRVARLGVIKDIVRIQN